MITTLARVNASIDAALERLAAFCLLAVMLIVFCDVGSRYLAARPFAWSYELIGMYLMPAVFYFALPGTLGAHHHVSVDLLRPRMSEALVRIVETVGSGATAAVFAMIAWLFAGSSVQKLRSDAVVMGVVEWPSWIPDGIVAIGSTAIMLRLVGRAVGHAVSLATGRSLIAANTAAHPDPD